MAIGTARTIRFIPPMNRVFAYGIVLAVMGYVFFAVVSYLERKVVFWLPAHALGGSPGGSS